MIVPEIVFSAIPWLFLVAFLAIPIVWRLTPGAKMNNWKRAGFVLGMIFCWGAWANVGHLGSEVLVVRMLGLGVPAETSRGRLFFSTTYRFGNGTQKHIGQLSPENEYFGTIVVNDSPEPMRVDMISYDSNPMFALANHTTPVPEHDVIELATAIDDVGPHELPPGAMSSPIPASARAWLTWGDADSDISFVEPRYGTDEWDAGADAN